MTTTEMMTAKYPAKAHAYAAWPLVLIFIGGAIGLVYSVMAYFINLKIYGWCSVVCWDEFNWLKNVPTFGFNQIEPQFKHAYKT